MRHAKRKRLDIADIQDEADIYDRLVIRQKQKAKRSKKQEDPYDEAEAVKYHEKLSKIEKKEPKEAEKKEKEKPSEEDLPALVESPELAAERSISGIPHLSTQCRYLLDNYEKMEMHLLFVDQKTNDDFRSFLAVLARDPAGEMGVSGIRRDLFVKVLKDSIAKSEAKKSIKKRFVEMYTSGRVEDENESKVDGNTIRRSVRKIKFPDNVLQLLDP